MSKTVTVSTNLEIEMIEHEENIATIMEAMADFEGLNFTVNSSGNKKWSTTTIKNLTWSQSRDFRGNSYISIGCSYDDEDEMEAETLNSINFYLDPVMVVDYNFGYGTLTITNEDGESIEFSEF